jgi:hypothetical protein
MPIFNKNKFLNSQAIVIKYSCYLKMHQNSENWDAFVDASAGTGRRMIAT